MLRQSVKLLGKNQEELCNVGNVLVQLVAEQGHT